MTTTDKRQIQRAAAAMIDRYRAEALNKAVRAARKYVDDGNMSAVRQWIEIGQQIRLYLDDPSLLEKDAQSVDMQEA